MTGCPARRPFRSSVEARRISIPGFAGFDVSAPDILRRHIRVTEVTHLRGAALVCETDSACLRQSHRQTLARSGPLPFRRRGKVSIAKGHYQPFPSSKVVLAEARQKTFQLAVPTELVVGQTGMLVHRKQSVVQASVAVTPGQLKFITGRHFVTPFGTGF